MHATGVLAKAALNIDPATGLLKPRWKQVAQQLEEQSLAARKEQTQSLVHAATGALALAETRIDPVTGFPRVREIGSEKPPRKAWQELGRRLSVLGTRGYAGAGTGAIQHVKALDPATEESRVLAARAASVRKRELMALRRKLGLTEAAVDAEYTFLAHEATWPNSRKTVLDSLREKLVLAVPEAGSLRDLRTKFKLVKLGSGANGIVYKACLKASEADESCLRFPVEGALHEVPLVIKTMRIQAARDAPAPELPPTHCFSSETRKCTVDTNSLREALMGNMLNLLVIRGATPHLPTVYEVFKSKFVEDAAPGRLGMRAFRAGEDCRVIVTEMCSLTMAQFLKNLIENTENVRDCTEILRVALLQIVHGLACAQAAFNFRHNDFHGQNAMMTFVESENYTYDVDGQTYSIPNYGMSWKPIDFGWSSSSVFGAHDNGYVIVQSRTASHYEKELFGFDADNHALEMYDIVRLMGYMKLEAEEREAVAVTAEKRHKYSVAKMLFQSGIELSELLSRGSRAKIGTYIPKGTATLSQAEKHSLSETAGASETTGLMQKFFKALASRYIVATDASLAYCAANGGLERCVFASSALFYPGQSLRGTFIGNYFTVNAAGKLVQTEGTSIPKIRLTL